MTTSTSISCRREWKRTSLKSARTHLLQRYWTQERLEFRIFFFFFCCIVKTPSSSVSFRGSHPLLQWNKRWEEASTQVGGYWQQFWTRHGSVLALHTVSSVINSRIVSVSTKCWGVWKVTFTVSNAQQHGWIWYCFLYKRNMRNLQYLKGC